MAFKVAALIGKHRNPGIKETILKIYNFLNSLGITAYIEEEAAMELPVAKERLIPVSALSGVEVCIAVGGDGNLLYAARELSQHQVPVIGVNRGQLGFLTDLDPEAFAADLESMLQGHYQKETRFLLSGHVETKEQVCYGRGCALNDVVLFPGDIAQLIEFELYINGQFVYSQRSDGLIIATPTGSTAYSLSAGGPIVQPDLNVVVVVPKFPHTLTSRPLVIDANSTIEIYLAHYNQLSPRLSYDGQHHETLNPVDKIVIHQQLSPLTLLHPLWYDYYATLRKKLQWGTQLIPLNKIRA